MEIIKAIIEGAGIIVFVWYFINGLKKEISSLKSTIENQNKTLEVMERRVKETEKVGLIYRNLMSDLPSDIENYKAIIKSTKDEVIEKLQNDKKQLDVKIKALEEEKIRRLTEEEEKLNEVIKLLPAASHQLLPEILNKDKLDFDRLAKKAAISTVMSRNASHNIGSHVLSNLVKISRNEPIGENDTYKELVTMLIEKLKQPNFLPILLEDPKGEIENEENDSEKEEKTKE